MSYLLNNKIILKNVASSLGKYNLEYLLVLNSYLSQLSYQSMSCKEYFKIWYSFNPIFLKKFLKSILLSNSKNYKDKLLSYNSIASINKKLNDFEEFDNFKCTDISALLLLPSIANTQVYYQDNDFRRDIGRISMIYVDIPDKYDLINCKRMNIVNMFKEKYGCSYVELFMGLLMLLSNAKEISSPLLSFFDEQESNNIAFKIIDFFNTNYKILKNNYVYSLSNLFSRKDFNPSFANSISNYIINNSINIKKFNFTDNPLMNTGEWTPVRITPFLFINEDNFIIPSFFELSCHIRKFMSFYIDTIDNKNQIFTNIGLAYEKYIYEYLIIKQKKTIIVPEINFSKNDKGSDILIIDKEKKTIIFIEVKTISISLDIRNDPQLLWDNRFNDFINTIYKLQKKVKRVFKKEGEYKKYEKDIDKCDIKNSILTLICGDLGYFVDYFFEAKLNSFSDINSDKFLLLDTVGIENLIEYSFQNGKNIVECFEKLLQVKIGKDTSTNIKDCFNDYDRKSSLLYQKSEVLLRDLQI